MKKRIERWMWFCLILSWVSGMAHAGMGPLAKNQQVQSFSLPDKTKLFLAHDHRVPVIGVMLFLPVGVLSPWGRSFYASQVLSMLAFDSQSKQVQQLGTLRIDQNRLGTVLNVSFLQEDAEKVMQLLHQILTNHDIDPDHISMAKKIIEWDWKQKKKEPSFLLGQAVSRLFFDKEDSRRVDMETPIPVTTDRKKLVQTRDRILRLQGRMVGFWGPVDRALADRLLAQLDLPAIEPIWSEPLPVLPKYLPLTSDAKDVSIKVKDSAQVLFSYARKGLSKSDPGYLSWLLADHIFAKGIESRLYVALRQNKGETYSPYTSMSITEEPGAFQILVSTRPQNADSVEKKLRALLQQFSQQGVSEEELQHALSHFQGVTDTTSELPEDILRSAMMNAIQGWTPDLGEKEMAALRQVSIEKLNQFIRTFYAPTQFHLVKVHP